MLSLTKSYIFTVFNVLLLSLGGSSRALIRAGSEGTTSEAVSSEWSDLFPVTGCLGDVVANLFVETLDFASSALWVYDLA